MTDVTTYKDAISDGLREEMQKDSTVFCVGMDIGVYGGAFGITKGFIEEFGAERIIETPISESAMMGLSMGAALMGLRPVAELQFADFLSSCFNQLVNNIAKYHYIHGIPVPLVLRCPCGGGVHGGPFHSQNNESWFFRVPGLKIVAPSTPYDAKGLLKSAIRDNNPVLFMEHKYLYRRVKEALPEEDYTVPIGKGIVRRVGEDATLVTYGSTVHMALEAASNLVQDGISIEVIDLRTVMPFDRDLIVKSAKKTGKVLIVHEESLTGGVGGELAALVAEEAFEYLDAPVRRLAGLDIPVPFSTPLEKYYLPSAKKISSALRELIYY